MPEATRYRYRSTEHFRETIDNRRNRKEDMDTNTVIYDIDHDHPMEQYNYSPDQFCVDTVGFRTRDNPLSLTYELSTRPRIIYTADNSHTYDFGGTTFKDTNYREFDGWGPNSHAIHYSEQAETDIEFVTRAVAGLNPSNSRFQAAVFLAELRDLPSLFKGFGDQLMEMKNVPDLLRASGREHLRINYGWAPMIRDLRTFFNVANKVRNRMKTLKELRGKGVIRRQYRQKDGLDTVIEHANTRLGGEHQIGLRPFDNDDTIWFDSFTEMRTTRWCDVEFILDTPDNLFDPIDSELWDEAHSLIYGTTIDGPALWQAMPWSWFIDWGTNMSEYILSQNNVVGAKFSKAVLMKTTRRFSTIYPVMDQDPGYDGQWSWTFLPGRLETITKERILDLEPAAVTTSEAILGDGFRSSILSALTIQKFKLPGRVRF